MGFRFTVQRYAEPLGLKGWVKNLPDGRVEILAQGTPEQIQRLCGHLEEHFEGYIKDKEIHFSAMEGNHSGFMIAH